MINELSRKDARSIIDTIAASVSEKTGKEVITDIRTRRYGKRGFCINTPTVKRIGVDTSWIESAPSVSMIWFADTVLTLWHEAQHMTRYNELDTGQGDTLIMALTIVDNINRSYYITNYPNNIRELDADMHAITNAKESLRPFFGENADSAVQASVLSRHRNPKRQNISKSIPMTEQSSISSIIAGYEKKINDIRHGLVNASDHSLSMDDPAFLLINSSHRIRKTFLSIPQDDFVTMTEFLAAISLHLADEILDEFPNNAYLHSLTVESFFEKMKDKPAARQLAFAANNPDWYKQAMDRSQQCIDAAQNHS